MEIERLKGQIEILSKNQNQHSDNYISNRNQSADNNQVDSQTIEVLKKGNEELKAFLQDALKNPAKV